DMNMVKTIGTGNESGGLYLFDVKKCGDWLPSSVMSGTSLYLSPNNEESDSSIGDGNGIASADHDSSHPVHDESNTNRRGEPHIVLRRSSRLSSMNFCIATTLNKFIQPKSYIEAAQDKKWVEAMNGDMKALYKNNTWVLTEYKARLVAKGFSQRERNDYEETFSHVVKMVTLRCIVSLAIYNGWFLFQLDVYNAFLYDDLNYDVYIDMPPGYCDENETQVCKLVKSLYELKQALRQWNEKLTTTLKENGLNQSINDYSLFVRNENGIFLALFIYVDDIVITSNSNEEIDKFQKNWIKVYMWRSW
ncbi:ribonuclease H-like domain-containing protein, partial [Tanacetum coccineum]